MPYFVRIGHIEQNKSKVGSRGWYIRRMGTKVVVEWGAVEVRRNWRHTRFYWVAPWPYSKTVPCRTVRRAEEEVEGRIARIVGPSSGGGGYSRLPPGVYILR